MLKSFRFRIALWFAVLSTVLYITLTAIGIFAFVSGTTESMDQELKVMASEFGHAVDCSGSKPTFRDWLRKVQTDPARGLAAIQLYDAEGNLLEEYGPKVEQKLLKRAGEKRDNGIVYRVLYTPLYLQNQIVGYLQFALPTNNRYKTIERLAWVIVLVGPCVIFGLAGIGYFVAALAAKPLEKNLESMRDFIADAGHELHTPLSLARAKIEALQSETDKEEVNAIGRSVERMEKIVDGLMYLTEIDARQEPSGTQSQDVKSMLEQIVDDFENRYNNKGVSLRLKIEGVSSLTAENAFFLRCDPELIYRAITNLVENALRYTESGGQVVIGLALSGDSIKISVSDTGIGIPPDSQSRIFERFYRVDKSRSRASGGVGLGLSIVKSICIKHKGSVSVESTPGQGSCFTMTFDLH